MNKFLSVIKWYTVIISDDAFHGVDTALLFQSTAVLGYEIEFKQFSASDLIVTKLLSDQLVNFVKFGFVTIIFGASVLYVQEFFNIVAIRMETITKIILGIYFQHEIK